MNEQDERSLQFLPVREFGEKSSWKCFNLGRIAAVDGLGDIPQPDQRTHFADDKSKRGFAEQEEESPKLPCQKIRPHTVVSLQPPILAD